MKIARSNEKLRKQTLESVSGFVKAAENRTADKVTDLSVLIAQAWCVNKLLQDEEIDKKRTSDPQAAQEEHTSPEPSDYKRFARFAIEEVLRRSQKSTKPPNNQTLLEIVVPSYEYLVKYLKSVTQSDLQAKAAARLKVDPYAAYFA